MVRLRQIKRQIKANGRNIFQFHMVRLRPSPGSHGRPSRGISIPHGTIKTVRLVFLQKIIPISIPHGTIKTERQRLFYESDLLFQFHMVRLRRLFQ